MALPQPARSRARPLSNIREKIHFAIRSAKTLVPNLRFRRAHPEFPVPPLYVLWDAQSYTDYALYRESGAAAAQVYWELFRTHVQPMSGATRPYRVLEWGCGPARIIRHLPPLAAADRIAAEFHGTDYNVTSIAWARMSLPQIQFALNQLAPPLPFPDQHFDFVYCRSVFTHLSEAMHFAWIGELRRVVRPGGVISLSTQGAAHRARLDAAEREHFDRGELVLRGLAPEGKLLYSAFHPPSFVRERLLSGLTVLQHDTPPDTQEVWVARRP